MLSADEAIKTCRSVRAFTQQPVERATIEEILDVAQRAPSGTNTQPWQVHVFIGEARDALCGAVLDAFWNEPEKHAHDRLHYMDDWRDPYLARRRKVGWDMYGLMKIERGEKEKMREAHARNFKFFDAPVGMIFTIDNDMGWMSWLDYGMFLQNICVAARARGLHTCAQAAWATYHTVIENHLGLEPPQLVHCGLSLGYEDPSAPVNELETVREPRENFVTFHGG